MSKKNFRWGIIGLGKIAHKFAQSIAVLEKANIYAVASRTPKKAKDFARQYNVEFSYTSYEDLMHCDGIDAIYIATPHILHFENTMLCLHHEIPVLCEKPFAMNNRQVQKMIALAKANNTFLMEALWTRFLPSIEKTLELIANDVIGEVHTVKADFGFKGVFDPQGRVFNNALGGGSLLDIGIYPLFLALLIFGKPNNIQASAIIGKTNVDETCAMILNFPKNKMAILDSTVLADTPTEAFIYGTKGTIHLHKQWHKPTKVSLHLYEHEVQNIELNYVSNGYSYEAEELRRCVENGLLESPKMNHAFSTLLMETMDTIRQKTGIHYVEDEL